MQPGVHYIRHPYRILTTPQEDAVAVAVMHDKDDVFSYVNSNVFEVGEVVAFRGTDGLPSICWVTHDISLRSLGLRRDFLAETAQDDDNICYSLDPNWKNASMVYAHVLRDGNDRVVTLFLEEVVTVTETKFLDVNRIIQQNSRDSRAIWRFHASSEIAIRWIKWRHVRGKIHGGHTRSWIEKLVTRHKKPWYIKIVGKEEAEWTDIKTSLLVYDKFDDRFLTCACKSQEGEWSNIDSRSISLYYTYLRYSSVLPGLKQPL